MCDWLPNFDRRRFLLRQAGLAGLDLVRERPSFALALIDGAVNAAHPAFEGCHITSVFLAGPRQSVRAADHATFSASILVGREADRRAGRVMALCQSAPLLNYACVTDEMLTGTTSIRTSAVTLATAVHLAVSAGCRAIAFGIEVRYPQSHDWNPLREAFDAAARAGAALFVPVGNRSGTPPHPPCHWPSALVTASCDKRGNLSRFSLRPVSAGAAIFAPGEDVPGAGPNNSYETRSGTSFATALAAGACGLASALAPGRSALDISTALWPPPRRILDGTRFLVREQGAPE
jgi:subtilisin family serine protease